MSSKRLLLAAPLVLAAADRAAAQADLSAPGVHWRATKTEADGWQTPPVFRSPRAPMESR